jgi:hypothetical protein
MASFDALPVMRVLVDETERKQGNDPEQDLEDADLKPFQRK